MESIKNKIQKYKYFIYDPINRKNIRLLGKSNSKREIGKIVLNKMKSKEEKTLVLLKLGFRSRPSKIMPGIVSVNYQSYLYTKNLKTGKRKLARGNNSGFIFFKKETLLKQGFKFEYLKRIVRKVFIDKVKVNVFGKYYMNL